MSRLSDFDDGDSAMELSDNMALDRNSGDIHFVSRWNGDD